MATNSEEVRIKIGVDKRSLVSDLTSVEQHFKNTVTKMGKDLIKLNLASLIGGSVMDVWDKFTNKLANAIYMVGQLGEKQRQARHQDYQDFLKQVAAEEKFQAEQAKKRDERDKTLGDAAKVDRQRQLLAEKDENKRAAMQKKFLDEELQALRDSLDLRGDIVDQSKTQLAIAQKQLEIANFENAATEKKAQLLRAIQDAQKGVNNATGNLRGQFTALSATSLGEAQSITDSALGAQNLPALRLSRKQMQDIRRAELLQRQAQQARIEGNGGLADTLTAQRLDILKRNPFLAEADRNPLKVAEDQLTTAKESLAELQKGLTIRTVKK